MTDTDIVQTSSMHSVASYALGPSANFSCPAQSRQPNAGSRTTYAALGSSDTQTELISWSGNLADKQEGTSQQKHSRTVRTIVLLDKLLSFSAGAACDSQHPHPKVAEHPFTGNYSQRTSNTRRQRPEGC